MNGWTDADLDRLTKSVMSEIIDRKLSASLAAVEARLAEVEALRTKLEADVAELRQWATLGELAARDLARCLDVEDRVEHA